MKIKLLQPLKDAGILHPADTELDMDEDTAHWLIEQAVAASVDQSNSSKPTNTQKGVK